MNKIARSIISIYNKTHWFTDKEAWALFRLFAFGEAVGWTLLISGIIYQGLHLPLGDSVIMLAGRIHGVLFLAYFTFVLLTARSMKWGVWRVLFGMIAGVLPYGSLIFEQIISYLRKKKPVFVQPPFDYDE